jgi:parallel beta-helix repeat protein
MSFEGCRNLTISSNTAHGDGIRMEKCSDTVMSGNTASSSGVAIYMRECNSTTIMSNTASNSGTGIYLLELRSSRIEGNTASCNKESGILFSNCMDCLILRNLLLSNVNNGLMVYGSSYNNTISGNFAFWNALGITVWSENSSVRGNIALWNYVHCVRFGNYSPYILENNICISLIMTIIVTVVMIFLLFMFKRSAKHRAMQKGRPAALDKQNNK